MADDTPNLALPYLAPSQAQKHVTHNEALRMLDAVVQLSVVDRTLTVPPTSPGEGERHIVATSGSGAWAGKDGQVAMWRDGVWGFSAPKPGWLAWVTAESIIVVRGASSWSPLTQNIAALGVNATADAYNRLIVAADASLFTNTGHGHQMKIVKGATGETASLLYQDNYSGRAEVGLCGDDDLHFKVSPDGSAWREPMVISAAAGVVRLASTAKAALPSPTTAGSGALAYVWDESGGAVLAFSDGGSWRRVTDRAVVS